MKPATDLCSTCQGFTVSFSILYLWKRTDMGQWHEDSTKSPNATLKQTYVQWNNYLNLPLWWSHAVTWSANLKDGMLYTCTIHSKEVQSISDNNPVLSVFFIIIPTLSQLTYLFSGEVVALFSRNLAGYCTICDWFLKE